MADWEEGTTNTSSNDQGSSWNSGGGRGRGARGRGVGGFKSAYSDDQGSSWNSGGSGGRGGSRGGFKNGDDDGGRENGFGGRGRGGMGGFRQAGAPASKTLMVNNLSFTVTEEALQATFEKAVSVRVPQMDGRPKGFAFVEFDNTDDAKDALENLNDTEIEGRTIRLEFSHSRDGGRGNSGSGEGGRGGFGGGGGSGEGGRGGFGGGGGYRGKDEEVFSKGPTKDNENENEGEDTRPKVTYIPPPLPEDEDSIFSHYESGINFSKYDNILVNVSGSNPPKAIMTFEEAGLCESLNRNISKSGYVKPTPVQKHGIPFISAGRDLMACAQTGSGKTAAFLLPILQQLMADGVAGSRFSELQEPEAIIVAPTRELINQIYMEARKFAFGTCVRPVVVYGGIATGHQIRELMKGCNVLCGTPGRLLDIIGRGKIGLSKLRYLVLDEADRMLDMGFEPDMRKLVGSPGIPSKEERQTLLFSATFPEDIQRLAADFLRTDYLFLAVGEVGGACSDVKQTLVEVTKFSKREQLLEILKATAKERTMVFVETKRQADFIATFLCQENIATTSIHGDREQQEREQALGDFRSGKCPVLVATSVAARGLDIKDVQHVVNFDLPSNIEEYVHRIGRTGRCGNTGRAVSFYDPEKDNQLARSLVKILSGAQQEVPSWLEGSAFSAHGTTGFNPRGNVFAATDSRKGDNPGNAQPAAQSGGGDDDDWE